jgi:hypothetical protein
MIQRHPDYYHRHAHRISPTQKERAKRVPAATSTSPGGGQTRVHGGARPLTDDGDRALLVPGKPAQRHRVTRRQRATSPTQIRDPMNAPRVLLTPAAPLQLKIRGTTPTKMSCAPTQTAASAS